MKTIKFNTKIILEKLSNHKKLKPKILDIINKSTGNVFKHNNDFYNDRISKCDWSDSENKDREWVKIIKKDIYKSFKKFAKELGFDHCDVFNIWFQQYKNKDCHNWHIHNHSYTGVYYLQFPKNSPKTELVDPFNYDKRFFIPAQEGDIVIFPSFIIHRGGWMNNNSIKTIISFNITFAKLTSKVLKQLGKK